MEIYTDGSCTFNPGPGGWAVLCRCNGSEIFKITGCDPSTTNNIMEMTAVIKALEKCRELECKNITIYSDSKYVLNGINNWITNWRKRGWKTSNGCDVKNRELWIMMDNLVRDFSITWKWVKGHSGNIYNEEVDKMARNSALSILSDNKNS